MDLREEGHKRMRSKGWCYPNPSGRRARGENKRTRLRDPSKHRSRRRCQTIEKFKKS